MHRRPDGRICFDGGTEEVERRMFEERAGVLKGAGEYFRMLFRELATVNLEAWQSWERVRKIAQDQGFIGPEDALDYDYIQKGFLVRPKGDASLKGRIAALQHEKLRAVEERNFEKAAWLRDYAGDLATRLKADEAPTSDYVADPIAVESDNATV